MPSFKSRLLSYISILKLYGNFEQNKEGWFASERDKMEGFLKNSVREFLSWCSGSKSD